MDETVSGLYFDDVPQALGTWGATGSTDRFGDLVDHPNDNFFAGDGVLTVIPEPASALLLIGAPLLALRRRRRAERPRHLPAPACLPQVGRSGKAGRIKYGRVLTGAPA